jgi:trk system potassium uptake protein TrkH
MNLRVVIRVLGFIAVSVGVAMFLPIAVALLFDGDDVVPLAVSAAIPLAVGFPALIATRGKKVDLGAKDGFAIVTFGWLFAGLFGALPFLLTGACGNPLDAVFESVSGFTTTGSTVLTDIEVLPPGLLMWRSLTQWLGGMGIIVLSVAILPILGIGGMQLYRAEVPGPATDRLAPRIQSAAKTLWAVYFAFTLAEIALLTAGGMSLYEATCHAFTTVSTGGFSTRNASIAAFDSLFLEIVIVVFMFLAGTNFSLHLWTTRHQAPGYWRSEEFRLYAIIVLLAAGGITASLVFRSGYEPGEASRVAVFQTVSILTTTGYGTGDYLLWAFGAQFILFLMMFLGACAGSTAGGMKLMRVVVLMKHALTQTKKELHPRAIYKIRYSGNVVGEEVMTRILGFFLLYVFLYFLAAFTLALLGLDLESALGASICTLSNIGPGFGTVGPASNFAHLPDAAKALLSFNMILGRLELYTVLVLLTPSFWNRT